MIYLYVIDVCIYYDWNNKKNIKSAKNNDKIVNKAKVEKRETKQKII